MNPQRAMVSQYASMYSEGNSAKGMLVGALPPPPPSFLSSTHPGTPGPILTPGPTYANGPIVVGASKSLMVVLLFIGVFGPGSAARAQEPEVAASYSFARITNGDGLNLPAGFLVSIAGGGRNSPWLVAEIGGNFRSEHGVTLKLFTVEGGVRFMAVLC